jgi:hypothetical protein
MWAAVPLVRFGSPTQRISLQSARPAGEKKEMDPHLFRKQRYPAGTDGRTGDTEGVCGILFGSIAKARRCEDDA